MSKVINILKEKFAKSIDVKKSPKKMPLWFDEFFIVNNFRQKNFIPFQSDIWRANLSTKTQAFEMITLSKGHRVGVALSDPSPCFSIQLLKQLVCHTWQAILQGLAWILVFYRKEGKNRAFLTFAVFYHGGTAWVCLSFLEGSHEESLSRGGPLRGFFSHPNKATERAFSFCKGSLPESDDYFS